MGRVQPQLEAELVDLVAGWALREHRFLPGGPREGEEPDRRGRFLRASVRDRKSVV